MNENLPDEGLPERSRGTAGQAARRRIGFMLPFLGVGMQLLLLVSVLFWQRIFILIEPGEAGVVWSRFAGTQIDRVRGEGLNIISPLDVMAIYEIRKQIVEHTFTVLSVEGMRLELDLAIRYRPERALLGKLHQRIGPDYLTRVVIPQTESVLRKQLGNSLAVQIYTNEGGLLTRAMLQAMAEIGRNFVEVEDIIIRRIRLPDMVREAIEAKVVQEQILLSYVFRREIAVLEADRLRIEATGVRDFQGIVDETLTEQLLVQQGIRETNELAESANSKTVVIGAGQEIAVPIFLGSETSVPPRVETRADRDSNSAP